MTRNPHEIVTLDDQPEDDDQPTSEDWEALYRNLLPRYRQLLHRPTDTLKPMRLRYMELPGEINPNTNELTTPFVIVIDRVTGGDIQDWLGNAIALNTGARGVLAFEQEIQIGDDPE